jgi:hypothetical protein
MIFHKDHMNRLTQARMARGFYRLPKVSPGPAMANPSMSCGWATPETALQPFWGWPTRRAGSLRPSSTPLDTPRFSGLRLIDLCKWGCRRPPTAWAHQRCSTMDLQPCMAWGIQGDSKAVAGRLTCGRPLLK